MKPLLKWENGLVALFSFHIDLLTIEGATEGDAVNVLYR